jgi:hypothetical protein
LVREVIEDAVGATVRFIFKVIIWDFVLFQVGRGVLLTATLAGRSLHTTACDAPRRIGASAT